MELNSEFTQLCRLRGIPRDRLLLYLSVYLCECDTFLSVSLQCLSLFLRTIFIFRYVGSTHTNTQSTDFKLSFDSYLFLPLFRFLLWKHDRNRVEKCIATSLFRSNRLCIMQLWRNCPEPVPYSFLAICFLPFRFVPYLNSLSLFQFNLSKCCRFLMIGSVVVFL